MAVSKALRFSVLERDGFTCQYCGATAQANALQVDHIISKALGGEDNIDNLITACKECNRGKGCRKIASPKLPTNIEQELIALKKRRELLIACAKERAAIEKVMDKQVWTLAIRFEHGKGRRQNSDGNWRVASNTLRHIRAMMARYPMSMIADSLDIAAARTATSSDIESLKYTYGILRNKAAEVEGGVTR